MKGLSSSILKEFLAKPIFEEKIILNKDRSWPKISIITPSYNQGRYLEKTILSVLNQNYPNLEYIIIDGGSSDNSLEIIKKYAHYLSYWVSEKDSGQCQAINKGLKKISEGILGWINSDDLYMPGALHYVKRVFVELPRCEIVYGAINYIDEDEKFVTQYYPASVNLKNLIYQNGVFQPSTFWTRESLTRSGLLNEKYAMSFDLDLWVRFFITKCKFVQTDNILSCFRVHNKSKTRNLKLLKMNKEERKDIFLNYMGREFNIMDALLFRFFYLALFYFKRPENLLYRFFYILWKFGVR